MCGDIYVPNGMAWLGSSTARRVHAKVLEKGVAFQSGHCTCECARPPGVPGPRHDAGGARYGDGMAAGLEHGASGSYTNMGLELLWLDYGGFIDGVRARRQHTGSARG